ncbi:MAG TPA: VOC family protein [Ktedonobacteraceae bacterium]|nr:VOC family protein [Ktedonobacteraceae bacterium]
MPRVVHFEIHADDPQRAVAFYQDIFGWQINKWEGPEDYWLVTTGPDNEPGINGAILRRHGPVSGDAVIAYVCTIDVPSVDDVTAKITAHGGTIALPKMAVPQIGWLAYGKDTEGNIFGVLQSDPSAA